MTAPLRAGAVACALLASAAARAQAPAPGVQARAPAQNWALPLFTKEGYRSMTLRGAEARPVGADRIEVADINITTFSGDASARVDTILLSSAATFFPREVRATGSQSVRVIRFRPDGGVAAEITGEDWSFQQAGKRVSIRRQAHVVFAEQLIDVLK